MSYLLNLQQIDVDMIKRNIVVLHDEEWLKKSKSNFFMSLIRSRIKLSDIKNYFGENIQLYFAFINYFIRRLMFPLAIGALVWVVDFFQNESVITSRWESVYSAFMVVWGAYFIYTWQNKEKEIRAMNCSVGKSIKQTTAIQYKAGPGLMQSTNPVTGEVQFMPRASRCWLYVKSYAKILPYLILLFIFLAVSLNIRGYVYNTSVIYNEFLTDQALEGGLFYGPKAFIATMLHILIVAKINF